MAPPARRSWTQFAKCFERPKAEGTTWFARLALVLIFAGLGFKLTAVPFHFYAPDVYQGTTNTNAAVLSVLPKLAAWWP